MTKNSWVTRSVIMLILVVSLAMQADTVLAQTYTPLEPLPCIPGNGVICPNGAGNPTNGGAITFSTYIQYIFNLFIALAAAASVFMITYGGFQYMTTDSWQGKSEGLGKVKNAVFGLLLVLASYLILRTVDPRLVAIPTTLVKPITMPDRNSNLDSFDLFMNQLERDTASYRADMAGFQSARQQARTQINTATQALNSKYDQLRQVISDTEGVELDGITNADIDYWCQNHSDAQVRSSCVEITNIASTINTTTSALTFTTAEAAIRASMRQCEAMSEPECFRGKGVLADISNIVSRYSPNISPEEKQKLQSYADYANTVIQINNLSSQDNTNKGFDIMQIGQMVTAYSNKPNVNSELLAKLRAYAEQIKTLIRNR